ncbi:MAG: Gfo/Idh/MocA family oxidoreductase [Verrucomicrobia bacterium]|nr:Gfo/Idh/MocA family oxidoreductase [Verrucomicrobiota bacterium]MBI3871203.1 Gfo/Idh/MocA family oxidoreductase [Verrucomicrobiota bacterium]
MTNHFKNSLCFALMGTLLAASMELRGQNAKAPVRVAVAGLAHDHALGFFPRLRDRPEVELVGVVETNRALIEAYSRRFNLSPRLFYPSLDALFSRTQAQAVAAFTSTFEHLAVVERCAKERVDVMMEKPLAVNMKHARGIEAAAKRGGVQVFVNYETTWYPANHAAYEMVHDRKEIGEIRRIVVHDGHRGPKEIGCSSHFLAWLTDPILNGGGALNDFGCYGADLATWLLDGQRPLSVQATTQRIKPDVYPKVEDEATIVLAYPRAQAIIQASWNWPFDRKDMEIYGRAGYVLAPASSLLRARLPNSKETEITPPALANPNADPISYLVAVARKEIVPSGLSSLSVNMTVVEILDAAHASARTGKRVDLKRN